MPVFVLTDHLGEDLIKMEKNNCLVFFFKWLYWENIFLIPLENVLFIEFGRKFLPLKVTLQIHTILPLCSLTCDNQNLGQIHHSFYWESFRSPDNIVTGMIPVLAFKNLLIGKLTH